MVWDLVLGFALLVVGCYVGTTLALRGFFGREYYDPRTGDWRGDSPPPGEGPADATDAADATVTTADAGDSADD
ncbi:MAG: hypothetical protein ABEJ40_09225 [Haloarculaceae archaeon]